jgi:recombination protein RecT
MAKEDLKTAVATRAQAGIQPGQDVTGTVAQMLADSWKLIQTTVPKHVTPERLTRVAVNTIRLSAELQKCTVPSLVGAIMQAARLGFEPNTTGECYLIPYKGECTLQIGYIGHIQLMHRSGMVASVGAVEVCANDTRVFAYGPECKVSLVKAEGDRGDVIGYFAWVGLRTGGYMWEYMTKKEVTIHRNKFSKMPNGKAWRDNFDSMGKKTVLLKVMKLAPKSAEINLALFADENVTRDPNRLDDIDVTPLPNEMMTVETIDETTGEVTDAEAMTADSQTLFSDGHE